MKIRYEDQYKDQITGEKLQVIEGVLIGTRSLACMTCGDQTVFIDICSEGHICSQECNRIWYEKYDKLVEGMYGETK